MAVWTKTDSKTSESTSNVRRCDRCFRWIYLLTITLTEFLRPTRRSEISRIAAVEKTTRTRRKAHHWLVGRKRCFVGMIKKNIGRAYSRNVCVNTDINDGKIKRVRLGKQICNNYRNRRYTRERKNARITECKISDCARSCEHKWTKWTKTYAWNCHYYTAVLTADVCYIRYSRTVPV